MTRFNPYEVLKRESDVELRIRKLPKHIRGYYACYKNKHFIVLDKFLTQAERRCVLTEELAHYFLCHSGNVCEGNYHGGLSFNLQEHDAKVWATDRLIDTHQLLKFMKQDHQLTLDDICDQFWVTPEFMLFKINRLFQLGYVKNFCM